MLPVWISIYVCSLSCEYVCPSWPPTLGQWKTFLLCAFGLCGRRERLIVPQAHRRRAHSCHTYTQNTHRIEAITQMYIHRPKPVPDYSGNRYKRMNPHTVKCSRTHSRRASQRAACQEGAYGRGCRRGARKTLELCHSHSVRIGAREQKTSLDRPTQSGLLHRLIPSQETPGWISLSSEFQAHTQVQVKNLCVLKKQSIWRASLESACRPNNLTLFFTGQIMSSSKPVIF